jgi:hypothetical protein
LNKLINPAFKCRLWRPNQARISGLTMRRNRWLPL